MKHIVRYINVVALLLVTSFAFGQSVEFAAKNFTDRAGLKTALRNIDEGDAYAEITDNATALDLYLKAQAFNPNNADLNYKIGKCYWLLDEAAQSISYFSKAIELDPVGSGFVYGVLGMAYQANYQFDEAISAFQKARARLTPEEKKEKGQDLADHIDQCNPFLIK